MNDWQTTLDDEHDGIETDQFKRAAVHKLRAI
jgi:hypothetical protein